MLIQSQPRIGCFCSGAMTYLHVINIQVSVAFRHPRTLRWRTHLLTHLTCFRRTAQVLRFTLDAHYSIGDGWGLSRLVSRKNTEVSSRHPLSGFLGAPLSCAFQTMWELCSSSGLTVIATPAQGSVEQKNARQINRQALNKKKLTPAKVTGEPVESVSFVQLYQSFLLILCILLS